MSMGFFVLASSTLTPFCNIGVMTMKMIRRTSITSAIGVTLISEVTEPRVPPPPIAIGLPLVALLLDEVVDQLGGRVRHFDRERFDFVREDVVGPDCGHRHEKTECGGHQSFRDTAGDGGQTGRLCSGHIFEGVDDTDCRSEQSHEWRRGSNGCKTGETALQFGVNDGFGALARAT